MLFKHATISPFNLKQEKVKARAIAHSIQAMGYSCAGIAPRDLAAGAGYLLELQRETGVQWLSINIMDNTGQNRLFSPYSLQEVNKINLAVVGVTDNVTRPSSADDFQIINWQEPLASVLNSLEHRADMIILLSSLPYKINKQIAKQFDTIHVILQSGHSKSNKHVEEINNTLICQTGDRGRYLGVMNIDWNKSKRWKMDDYEVQGKNLFNQLDRINWQIHRKEKRLSPEKLAQDKQYLDLVESRQGLKDRIETMKTNNKNIMDDPCSYENRFIALQTSIPESNSIKSIIDRAKKNINKINRRSFRPEKITTAKNQITTQLSGWQACNRCHPRQTTFWKTTKHAGAWQTLVANKQQFNPQCIICHITLPSYSQGPQKLKEIFTNLTPEQKTVACEACHGPGKKHAKRPREFRVKTPASATCLQCHTPERDDDFHFTVKEKIIRCPPIMPASP